MTSQRKVKITEEEKDSLLKALDGGPSSAFVTSFRRLLDNFEKEKYTLTANDARLNTDMKRLIKSAEKLDPVFLPYASITSVVYKKDNLDNLSDYSSQMKNALKTIVNDGKDNVAEIRCVIKLIEHFDLAINQAQSLYNEQKKQIEKQKKELANQRSEINEQRGFLEDIRREFRKVQDLKHNIYTDFISILGIFTAITFATFGGLQLLGNVFGNVKFYSTVNIGSVMMLGAIYLIGTYFLLVALLKGVSGLTGRRYNTPFRTRYVMVYTFSAIFLFGLLYAHKSWILKFLSINGWRKWALLALVGVVILGLPILLDYVLKRISLYYDKKVENTKEKSKD